MYIIKLGGSVITDKTKENCFKKKIVDNLAKAIKKAKQETIIIHGAGSFGHIIADKYRLNMGYRFFPNTRNGSKIKFLGFRFITL